MIAWLNALLYPTFFAYNYLLFVGFMLYYQALEGFPFVLSLGIIY